MAEEITKVIENVDELFPEIVVNGESHISDRYVEPEPTPSQSLPQSSEEQTEEPSQQTVQGEYVDTLNLNGVEHDLKDSPLSAEVRALQELLGTIQSRLNELSALIPNQASAQNQLADKNFVNSSIATNTANFLGTYSTLAEIEAIPNPTNNDYAFLETADGAGNNVYDRYKYSAEDGEWLFEYELNNSSFTAEQWATINSGISQVSDTVQDGDSNPVSSDAVYEALQNAGGGGGAQCDTEGNVQAKVASMKDFVLNSGVTFPITFANSNSYNGKITLNVNSTGAKDVYINNAVSSSSNKTLNAGSYICQYNGTNYYIDTSCAVTKARNANYSSYTEKVQGNYTGNGGQQNPQYVGKNRVCFNMMNTSINGNTQYKDFMMLDCYSGFDVGGTVALGVCRQSMRVFAMRADAGTSPNRPTSWANTCEINTTTYTQIPTAKPSIATNDGMIWVQ